MTILLRNLQTGNQEKIILNNVAT